MRNAVTNLIAERKIPTFDDVQMVTLLNYLYTTAKNSIRLRVAETVYRYDHDHPRAQDVFFACIFPLAARAANSRAQKLSTRPSDWQVELMYDGATEAAIRVFQSNNFLEEGDEAFARYLFRALARGTAKAYFMRQEYSGIRAVGSLTKLAKLRTRSTRRRNKIEEEMITRELLNQVTSFPHLPSAAYETLQCIRTLGPDKALKEHAPHPYGDRDKHKRERGRRPILDPTAIAEAMGADRVTVNRNLYKARRVLRDVFNADGKLFLSR